MINIENTICKVLSKEIEQPILTDREKLILTAIQGGQQSVVELVRKNFKDSKTTICPYCYQSLEEKYKQSLLESIDRVLNKDVDIHGEELMNIVFPQISLEYAQYSSLDIDLTNKIKLQVSECNNLIKKYQDDIKKKSENIYTPIITTVRGLEDNITHLNHLLAPLESKRNEFNDAISKSNSMKIELLNINKQIAHLQIMPLYKDYLKQANDKKTIDKNLVKRKGIFEDTSKQLVLLQQSKANTILAISNINNALDYVFFSQKRLSIEFRDDKYYLKSKGKDVRPKHISLGERNILAFCYFFTEIMANQEMSKLYQNEQLVVIDDPISSFDFENKVGISSLLRYQVNRIITGNKYSKVLVLSHELTTIFDLIKTMNEICDLTKGDASIQPSTFSPLELFDFKLKRFTNKRNEYSELMQMIYNYANGDLDEKHIVIGNAMRRVLEAFSTFTYKKGIEDISRDIGILKMLGGHSIYFGNLMYRLVLHSESHYQEQISSLHDDTNFYEFISDTEKNAQPKMCYVLCIC